MRAFVLNCAIILRSGLTFLNLTLKIHNPEDYWRHVLKVLIQFSHFEVSLAQVVKKTGIKTATQVWGVSGYLKKKVFSPQIFIQLLEEVTIFRKQ